jgi:hypothetical protein
MMYHCLAMEISSLRKDLEGVEKLVSQHQKNEVTKIEVDAENEGCDHHHSRRIDDLRLGRPSHLLGLDYDLREKVF